MESNSSGRINISALLWGTIFILLGLLFLLDNMDLVDASDVVHTYWPIILILVGVALIVRRTSHIELSSGFATRAIGDKDLHTTSSKVFHSNVFGDVRIVIDTKDFQGGQVNTVFGDVHVDMTQMDFPSGERTLQMSTVFGDMKAIVPKGMAVHVKGSGVFGDQRVFDRRQEGFIQNMVYQSEGYDQAEKRLSIHLSHVFGDITVS